MEYQPITNMENLPITGKQNTNKEETICPWELMKQSPECPRLLLSWRLPTVHSHTGPDHGPSPSVPPQLYSTLSCIPHSHSYLQIPHSLHVPRRIHLVIGCLTTILISLHHCSLLGHDIPAHHTFSALCAPSHCIHLLSFEPASPADRLARVPLPARKAAAAPVRLRGLFAYGKQAV